MSFAPETEKLVNELIQAEYKNACENWGEKYHSLHEGYAILKEEIEEVEEQTRNLRLIKFIWNEIKEDRKCNLYRLLEFMEKGVICAIKELAQVGAVLQKIKNTVDEVVE